MIEATAYIIGKLALAWAGFALVVMTLVVLRATVDFRAEVDDG